LENQLYHAAIMAADLSAIVTGVFMMFRVRTVFFPRNPYLFSDMTWGMVYVLYGLAGVGLIALIMVHVYFGLRPEKRAVTKSMIFGGMGRDFYLKEHDQQRWPIEPPGSTPAPGGEAPEGLRDAGDLSQRCDTIEERYEFMLA
jgi:cytochrome b subunit of formate dehydrogenase